MVLQIVPYTEGDNTIRVYHLEIMNPEFREDGSLKHVKYSGGYEKFFDPLYGSTLPISSVWLIYNAWNMLYNHKPDGHRDRRTILSEREY